MLEKIRNASLGDVLIVGNADYISKRDWSSTIDSFPCVVRFNHGILRNGAGSRFTVMVMGITDPSIQHALWDSMELKPKIVMHLHPCVPTIQEYEHILYRQTEKEYDIFRATFGAEPSSGAMSIDWFLRNTKAKIHLLGFDGMRTKSFYHENSVPHVVHSPTHEQMYISNVIRQGLVRSIG